MADDVSELMGRLDRASDDAGAWDGHTEAVSTLHGIALRCLEERAKRRAEVSELLLTTFSKPFSASDADARRGATWQVRELIPQLEACRVAAETAAAAAAKQKGEFICPLSLELMSEPVVAADGITYERAHARSSACNLTPAYLPCASCLWVSWSLLSGSLTRKVVLRGRYERCQIELWLSKKRTSPITGVPLAHTHLTPNLALKALIASR